MKRNFTAAKGLNRCEATIKIGKGKHDYAYCLRAKAPGNDHYCKQHAKMYEPNKSQDS